MGKKQVVKKSSSSSAFSTIVLRCTCEHLYQDKRYGRQRRVMNSVKDSGVGTRRYRCTICENVN